MNLLESQETIILPQLRLPTLFLLLDEVIAESLKVQAKLPKAGEVRQFHLPDNATERFAQKRNLSGYSADLG